MASPTLLSLVEALRQAVVDHPEDTEALSPAEPEDWLGHLLFVEDDLKNSSRGRRSTPATAPIPLLRSAVDQTE